MIKKSIVGLAVCLWMLVAANAQAQCPFYADGQSEDFCYTVSENTATIVGYVGTNPDIVIPGVIDSMPVTNIGEEAFYDYSWLTSVTIPDSVNSIEPEAFKGCSSLSIAYFLGDAPAMGGDVFENCASDFNICYKAEATGFITPTWEPTEWDSYPAAPCDCSNNTDCAACHECVDGLCMLISQPSFGNWSWMGGMEAPNWSEGNYGTKGVPAAANVPVARKSSISWTDVSGNLWLFGGTDPEWDYLNDLWRYDTASTMWTWISGSNLRNRAGTYGTKGVPAAANVPGARDDSISWTDSSDNLWLFGGGNTYHYAYLLNDLWRYSTTTNEWTWMSGADTDGQAPVYGTQGTPSAANVPGARAAGISWADSSGNLWLFGGYGYHQDNDVDYYGYLNDLWRYDIATHEWTWMSGADTFNQPGIYGIKGETNPANMPGARLGSITWTDSSGKLWLFGGRGYDSTGNEGLLNDLWRYNSDTNQWAWMSGADLMDQIGTYGTRGTADVANMPGARSESISWSDDFGNLWLFGGEVKDSQGNWGYFLNDLWRYDIGTGQWTWVSGSNVPTRSASMLPGLHRVRPTSRRSWWKHCLD